MQLSKQDFREVLSDMGLYVIHIMDNDDWSMLTPNQIYIEFTLDDIGTYSYLNFMNSRYVKMMYENENNKLEHWSKSYKINNKFRKQQIKDKADLKKKLLKYITEANNT